MGRPYLSQWTLVDLLTIVMGVLVILAMLAVSLRPQRTGHPRVYTTYARGITHSMHAYAATNKGHFPGISSKGKIDDVSVEHRYWLLLDQNYFGGRYVISPSETKQAWTTGAVSSANYSYSMLKIDGQPGDRSRTARGRTWYVYNDLYSEAPLISDRNTGPNALNVMSLRSPSQGAWLGVVGWHDGHATDENTHQLTTRYGTQGSLNTNDNLFDPAGNDDAYMIYTGN